MLHSLRVEFELDGRIHRHEAPPPRLMSDLGLCGNPRLATWLCAVDRRERWLRSLGLEPRELARDPDQAFGDTLRWVHTEGDPLRVEQLGEIFSLQWFAGTEPSADEIADLQRLMRALGADRWRLQHRLDRGAHPLDQPTWRSDDGLPGRWTAREGDTRFEMRFDSGLSTGLFLDQRRNRAWVREHAGSRAVLNLFCYTAGFSVSAALGGASKVVSVDVSSATLEWAKRNFRLNGLDPEAVEPASAIGDPAPGAGRRFEFRAMDAREYLAWARKKGLRFDLVICDPPSFGRSAKGVFRLEKDLPALIESLAAVLAPGGTILFCCNYEAWDDEEFRTRLSRIAQDLKPRLRLAPAPPPDWDFELPREPRLMKSALLTARAIAP